MADMWGFQIKGGPSIRESSLFESPPPLRVIQEEVHLTTGTAGANGSPGQVQVPGAVICATVRIVEVGDL